MVGFEILHQVFVISQRQLTLLKLLGNAKSCLAFWLPNYYNELLALLDLKDFKNENKNLFIIGKSLKV